MKIRRLLARFLMVLLGTISAIVTGQVLSGCAAVVSALPTIITVVTEAGVVLNTIQHYVDLYFAAHPDTAKQHLVDSAIGKCHVALVGAEKATAGVEDLTQEKIDAAFLDFKTAYIELMDLVGPLGITQATGIKTMRAAPGGHLEVPPADSLVPKLKKK